MNKKTEPVKQIRVELELYNALVKIRANSVVKASLPAVLGHAIRNGIDATRKFFQPKTSTKKKGQ
jgi:hypothetical protein